ncbi:U5 snRNP-specific subunit [Babesia caballi]|uniref:U5 snRNP-specific subunit n=1 Tax=Babesia caballi TaxID=5871 RepID=A0AAV4LX13_BABCB|nr:U5 snRNP-specific subunit [Babesia caballi]
MRAHALQDAAALQLHGFPFGGLGRAAVLQRHQQGEDGAFRAHSESPRISCTPSLQHSAEKNLIRARWGKDTIISSGSADHMAYILDARDSKVLYQLPGHIGSVNEVVLHPSEPIAVSCFSTSFLSRPRPRPAWSWPRQQRASRQAALRHPPAPPAPCARPPSQGTSAAPACTARIPHPRSAPQRRPASCRSPGWCRPQGGRAPSPPSPGARTPAAPGASWDASSSLRLFVRTLRRLTSGQVPADQPHRRAGESRFAPTGVGDVGQPENQPLHGVPHSGPVQLADNCDQLVRLLQLPAVDLPAELLNKLLQRLRQSQIEVRTQFTHIFQQRRNVFGMPPQRTHVMPEERGGDLPEVRYVHQHKIRTQPPRRHDHQPQGLLDGPDVAFVDFLEQHLEHAPQRREVDYNPRLPPFAPFKGGTQELKRPQQLFRRTQFQLCNKAIPRNAQLPTFHHVLHVRRYERRQRPGVLLRHFTQVVQHQTRCLLHRNLLTVISTNPADVLVGGALQNAHLVEIRRVLRLVTLKRPRGAGPLQQQQHQLLGVRAVRRRQHELEGAIRQALVALDHRRDSGVQNKPKRLLQRAPHVLCNQRRFPLHAISLTPLPGLPPMPPACPAPWL